MVFFEPRLVYDHAIIEVRDGVNVYDFEKMIEVMTKAWDMTYTEAVEWIDYNMGPCGIENWPIIHYPEDSETEDGNE